MAEYESEGIRVMPAPPLSRFLPQKFAAFRSAAYPRKRRDVRSCHGEAGRGPRPSENGSHRTRRDLRDVEIRESGSLLAGARTRHLELRQKVTKGMKGRSRRSMCEPSLVSRSCSAVESNDHQYIF